MSEEKKRKLTPTQLMMILIGVAMLVWVIIFAYFRWPRAQAENEATALETPPAVKELTHSMVTERMADPEYIKALGAINDQRVSNAVARAEIGKKIEEFFAANPDKTNEPPAELTARLAEIAASDSRLEGETRRTIQARIQKQLREVQSEQSEENSAE